MAPAFATRPPTDDPLGVQLDEKQVAAMVESQYDDIAELRSRMAEVVARRSPATILAVGEGCHRVSTFVGGCLAADALPGTTHLVVPFDVRAVPESFHWAGPQSVGQCRIAPMLGSVLDPPLRTKAFDLVASSMMVDDVADPVKAVAMMLGLVADDGSLVISGHGIDEPPELAYIPELLGSNHPDQIYPDQVEAWIDDHGGRVISRWQNDHTWMLEADPR